MLMTSTQKKQIKFAFYCFLTNPNVIFYACNSRHRILCILFYAFYYMSLIMCICILSICILCIVFFALYTVHCNFKTRYRRTDRMTNIVRYRAVIAAKNAMT